MSMNDERYKIKFPEYGWLKAIWNDVALWRFLLLMTLFAWLLSSWRQP